MTRTTRTPRTHRHDRGFTLVELVVAMFLLGVLGVMVTTSIRVVARTSTGVTERVDAQQQARVALGALTRDIRLAARVPGRTAPPIRVAEPDRITFTANVDRIELPELVEVAAVAEGLRETQVVGRVRTDAGVQEVVHDATPTLRYLARDAREGDLPVFTYYDETGADLAGADGSVASGDLGRIRLVRISVEVKTNPNSSAAATVLTSTVRLVNEQARG